MTTVQLDDPEHALQIGADADYRGWRSHAAVKEPYTFEWIKEIGTGTLYDVGACVGSYSLMAAARGTRVIAFEPLPWNYAECWKNVLLNGMGQKVLVLPYAAFSQDGAMRIRTKYLFSGWGEASIVPKHQGFDIEVPTIRLETAARLYNEQPTHIKIDVEGGEMGVVQGMGSLLDSVKSVIIEGQSGEQEAVLRAVMEPHGLVHEWAGGKRRDTGRMHIFRRQR